MDAPQKILRPIIGDSGGLLSVRRFSQNRPRVAADSSCAAVEVNGARRDWDPCLRSGQVDSCSYFERRVVAIAALSREEVKKQIKGFKTVRKLDFTDDYLDAISLDRLRHILLAVVLTGKPNN